MDAKLRDGITHSLGTIGNRLYAGLGAQRGMKPRPSLRETDTGISNCSISHGCGGGDDDGDKDDSEWHLLLKDIIYSLILQRWNHSNHII